MNDTPTAPGPGARPGRDHRPGLRTLLVPRLLSRVLSPAQVARSAGVPTPLVTLITDHEAETPSRTGLSRRSRHPSGSLPARGRRNAAPARLLFMAAATAGCARSILWHEPLLPIVLVVAGSLAGNSLRTRFPAGRRPAPRTGNRK